MKKKRNLYILAFLCFITLVGVTIAYFTSTSTLENEFKSGKYKTVTEENFTSPTNWKPGDTTPKTITTTNQGTLPVRVRVKLEESWTSENNNDLPLKYNNERVSIINFDNQDDWIKDGDYYYYIGDLAPGDSTSSLIQSVTYNPNTPSDINCTSNNGVYNCQSSGDGYDGGTYTLNITIETVQADAVLSAWNLSSDPAKESYAYTSITDGIINNGENISLHTTQDDYQSTNKKVFLRYKVLGQTIKEASVGFITYDDVHYLKGAGATYNEELERYNDDSIYYEENKTTLLNTFGSERCTVDTLYIMCQGFSIVAYADEKGHVYTFSYTDTWQCDANKDGSSICTRRRPPDS